jgi:hyperosmotically inducible protein
MQRIIRRAVALLPVVLLAAVTSVWADSDTLITVNAKIALLTTDGVSVSDVKVDSHSGAVTLHGKVKSEAEKAKAETVIKKVDGVKSVQNLLQVVPASIRNAVNASDSQLKEQVTAALKADATLRGCDVKVTSVDAGVVLLSGNAQSLEQKLEAIERAYSVRGVVRVASEIRAPISTE